MNDPDRLEDALLDLTRKKFGTCFFQQPGPSETSKLFGGENAVSTQALREATAPVYGPGGLMSMIEGSMRNEAAAIDIPIFWPSAITILVDRHILRPENFQGRQIFAWSS